MRYMAPEVLEGAVNLRECESSLKQIDVYSLGLVLWEIAYRCRELYPSKEAPPYQLPFEAEIGNPSRIHPSLKTGNAYRNELLLTRKCSSLSKNRIVRVDSSWRLLGNPAEHMTNACIGNAGAHPTQDQMKTLVCRHKARPLLPESWRDVCVSERLLKATLEDAWDQDAEARLTSLCVEQRLAELSGLWHRQQRFKLVNPALQANVSVVTGAAESSEAQPVTAVAASSVMVSEAPSKSSTACVFEPPQLIILRLPGVIAPQALTQFYIHSESGVTQEMSRCIFLLERPCYVAVMKDIV